MLKFEKKRSNQFTSKISSSLAILTIILIIFFSLFHYGPFVFRSSHDGRETSSSFIGKTGFQNNPIFPDVDHSEAVGTVFDVSVLYDQGLYKMYASWRPNGSIIYTTSRYGMTWEQDFQCALPPWRDAPHSWDSHLNRPFIMKRAVGEYIMWYTGQSPPLEGQQFPSGGVIGLAKSRDGVQFTRVPYVNPVMVADLAWERYIAVMTPSVIELDNNVLRMYYSGGESEEPDAIGVAHSYDGGVTWVKHGDPVFLPDPTSPWDNFKVTAPHVVIHDGWYYLFYCGFKDGVQATINLARSRNGLTNWQRSVENPIVTPLPQVEGEPDPWNCHATYKPFVMFDDLTQQWFMWFNGRCYDLERIGMATLKGDFGKFVNRGRQERDL